MKRYKSIFKESIESDVKDAMKWASGIDSPRKNRIIANFITYLDGQQYNETEIIPLIVQNYEVDEKAAKNMYKDVIGSLKNLDNALRSRK